MHSYPILERFWSVVIQTVPVVLNVRDGRRNVRDSRRKNYLTYSCSPHTQNNCSSSYNNHWLNFQNSVKCSNFHMTPHSMTWQKLSFTLGFCSSLIRICCLIVLAPSWEKVSSGPEATRRSCLLIMPKTAALLSWEWFCPLQLFSLCHQKYNCSSLFCLRWPAAIFCLLINVFVRKGERGALQVKYCI